MRLVIALLLCLVSCSVAKVSYQYKNPPETTLYARNGSRVRGIRDLTGKDIVLGGLFTVSEECGNTIFEPGIEMLEAMLHAIDTINSDPTLLPNVTLGYDIRDTCKRENVALDETISMLFNGEEGIDSCPVANATQQSPVTGIIGAYESFISIPLAGLLRLFKKPQIAYGSSSTALSDRKLYSFFYRTFPPDDKQAEAMIDLILHFGWDHISTINSNNLYGQRGIEEVKKFAAAKSICIDFDAIITDQFTLSDYTDLALKLLNSSADVVVLFASVHHARGFLTELSKVQASLGNHRQFLWIASDAWAELTEDTFQNITTGRFGFPVYSENFESFQNYISELTLSSNQRDPWFKLCTKCSINTTSGYQHFSVVPLVTDAVYAVAHAIHNFIQENCPHPLEWHPFNQSCNGYNKSLNGETLRDYINEVNFTSPTNERVAFDESGNVKAKYSILNYQRETRPACDGVQCLYKLVKVGLWNESATENKLKIFTNVSKQFGINKATGQVLFSLVSRCQICSPGHYKRSVASSCCGTCDPCLGSNYTNSNSSTSCMMCPVNMWGNNPLSGSTHCIDINESFLKLSDVWGIVLILLAIIGLIAVILVTSVFIWFWNTPIVKSSGREQMILVLVGLTLCLFSALLYLLKPSPAVCGLQRIGLWFSSSLILSALLVKLIRITRIFMQRKVSTRPMLVAPAYQILFTFILVGFQMILVIVSLAVAPPDTKLTQKNNEDNHNDYPTLVLQCTSPHTAMIVLLMLYYTALLVTSNILAVLTIRFPDNFNESKYVSFATFSLTFLWLVFIPSYVITAKTINQGPVTSFMIQISSIVTLLSLFGLRCLIMIFWPKKNVYTLDPSSTGKGLNKMLKSSLQTTKATTLDSIQVAVEEKKQEEKK